MREEFREPDFTDKFLEFRFENGEVCIYGNKEGLRKLSDLCLELIENPDQSHIHLNRNIILTKESLPGAIAIFD